MFLALLVLTLTAACLFVSLWKAFQTVAKEPWPITWVRTQLSTCLVLAGGDGVILKRLPSPLSRAPRGRRKGRASTQAPRGLAWRFSLSLSRRGARAYLSSSSSSFSSSVSISRDFSFFENCHRNSSNLKIIRFFFKPAIEFRRGFQLSGGERRRKRRKRRRREEEEEEEERERRAAEAHESNERKSKRKKVSAC